MNDGMYSKDAWNFIFRVGYESFVQPRPVKAEAPSVAADVMIQRNFDFHHKTVPLYYICFLPVLLIIIAYQK